MDEKVNTLIKESPSIHTLSGSSVGLETLTGGSELGDRIISRQADGPNDGDVGLELGPTELSSKSLHQLLQSGCNIIRWDRPHRIHVLLDLWVCSDGFGGCHGDGGEEQINSRVLRMAYGEWRMVVEVCLGRRKRWKIDDAVLDCSRGILIFIRRVVCGSRIFGMADVNSTWIG